MILNILPELSELVHVYAQQIQQQQMPEKFLKDSHTWKTNQECGYKAVLCHFVVVCTACLMVAWHHQSSSWLQICYVLNSARVLPVFTPLNYWKEIFSHSITRLTFIGRTSKPHKILELRHASDFVQNQQLRLCSSMGREGLPRYFPACPPVE